MADPVVFQAVFVMGDTRQRDALASGGDHLHLIEGYRVPGVFRVDLHHHLILVEAVINGGNLSLAVGVVQHGCDHVHVNAQALGLIAVDHQRHLLGTPPLAGIDGRQLGQGLERFDDFRVPLAQCPQIATLQDVGILRGGLLATTTKLQILVGHEHQLTARHLGHRLA